LNHIIIRHHESPIWSETDTISPQNMCLLDPNHTNHYQNIKCYSCPAAWDLSTIFQPLQELQWVDTLQSLDGFCGWKCSSGADQRANLSSDCTLAC